MPRKVAAPKTKKAPADVSAFLRALDHPLKPQIEQVRALILGADGAISEAIKWNAPSFRTSEFFATVNLRAKDEVQLVFHLGAKVRDNSSEKMQGITDPSGLIRWLASDRCLVTLPADGVAKHAKALRTIVREWVRRMDGA